MDKVFFKIAGVLDKDKFKLTLMEWFVGFGLASVSIGLTIFTAVLVKCFETTHNLPTIANLAIIRGVLLVFLYAVAVAQGDQLILPPSKREKVLVVARGFFTGCLFTTNIAALRFLPLGDFFTILTARSIFCILVPALIFSISKRFGKPFDNNKLCLVLVAVFGFYLFLSTKTGEGDYSGKLETPDPSLVPVPWFACFPEKPLSDNTVTIGMAIALLNLVLNVPIMYLTKMCEGTSASVQSFWSGVGGLLVGVVTSFFDIKTSIFSGYYSVYGFCMILLISISFITIIVVQSQATKFISTPTLNIIRLVQIPIAYLMCPSEVMPDFYSVVGLLFILSSSVVGDWVLHMEDKTSYQEIPNDPQEEILPDESH